jgi:hypothetical protein
MHTVSPSRQGFVRDARIPAAGGAEPRAGSTPVTTSCGSAATSGSGGASRFAAGSRITRFWAAGRGRHALDGAGRRHGASLFVVANGLQALRDGEVRWSGGCWLASIRPVHGSFGARPQPGRAAMNVSGTASSVERAVRDQARLPCRGRARSRRSSRCRRERRRHERGCDTLVWDALRTVIDPEIGVHHGRGSIHRPPAARRRAGGGRAGMGFGLGPGDDPGGCLVIPGQPGTRERRSLMPSIQRALSGDVLVFDLGEEQERAGSTRRRVRSPCRWSRAGSDSARGTRSRPRPWEAFRRRAWRAASCRVRSGRRLPAHRQPCRAVAAAAFYGRAASYSESHMRLNPDAARAATIPLKTFSHPPGPVARDGVNRGGPRRHVRQPGWPLTPAGSAAVLDAALPHDFPRSALR